MDGMDLRLETVRTRGRAARRIAVEEVRELEEADLALLGEERGVKPHGIKKLRDRHHALARCLADGLTDAEASAVTGYDGSRISVLKGDPAFKELVEFYRANRDAQYVEMHEALAGLGRDAVLELRDRMEDEPEKFTNKELRELVTNLADRTGHGPTSKQEHTHTVNVGARLEAARQRMIDVTPRGD